MLMELNKMWKKKPNYKGVKNMYFMNEDHAYNFQNMILQDKTHVNDRERFALFYILGG
ncbi:DUF6075 family protein [Fusibacter sp. A1]|uniref:DUF6075 family protein n=1 Tax=Fusibacter sp. A1 TaxID=2283630 RepID=UPI00352FD8CB